MDKCRLQKKSQEGSRSDTQILRKNNVRLSINTDLTMSSLDMFPLVIQGAPSICSWANGRLDIFAIGTNHHLFHKWFQGGWSAWEDLGGVLSSEPAAVSWGPNRIDVFYPGQNLHMWHRWWNGSNWSGEEDLGGSLSSGVGVSSWGQGRLDCFVQGTDSAMHHKWYS